MHENAPKPGRPGKGGESMERGLSMDEQVKLALNLLEAFDARNRFTDSFGGFDDFADVHQHVGDRRGRYDRLANEALRLRQELDEGVPDKHALVAELRNRGAKGAADRIAKVFQVH